MTVCVNSVDKNRLNQQMYRVREIRILQAEIKNIEVQLSGPKGIQLTDMPRSQNPFDKVGSLIARKIEKENKIQKLIKKAASEKIILEAAIANIATLPENAKGPLNSVFQDILKYRYLDDCSWEEINIILNSNREDFLEMTDSRLRMLYRWHGIALNKFLNAQKMG